jgi:hypothetical protein
MKVNWTRVALAGILGTILFDMVGILLTHKFWDFPTLLGSKLLGGGHGALLAGVAAHYANGVLIAILYAALEPSLWGSRWARAFTFITAQTVFGVWLFMLPLLGAGFMGLKMGRAIALVTLLRHWAYAIPMVWLSPLQEQLVQPPVTTSAAREEPRLRKAA